MSIKSPIGDGIHWVIGPSGACPISTYLAGNGRAMRPGVQACRVSLNAPKSCPAENRSVFIIQGAGCGNDEGPEFSTSRRLNLAKIGCQPERFTGGRVTMWRVLSFLPSGLPSGQVARGWPGNNRDRWIESVL
jgi:hypothetical protein